MSSYTYDPATHQYRDSEGQVVSAERVRQMVYTAAQDASDRAATITAALLAGDIDHATWQAGMRDTIRAYHVAAAVVARGGWAQMTRSDWGHVGRAVRTQYTFLTNFANDLAAWEADPAQRPADGVLLARAGMYAQAAKGVFNSTQRRVEAAAGATEERRVLGRTTEHCATCLALADRGWVPIGTLPPIGDSDCLTNCHCGLDFR